jgi:group I intron endonuclease
MNYIIYKTTNLLNGMYYIGCHQTNDLNDGYLGSGKHLKRAIKKYGHTNFKFEILYSVSTKEEMFELERSIVNEDLVRDTLTYNLKIGGSGGNPGIIGAFKGRKHSRESIEKIRDSALKQIASVETRKKMSANNAMKNNPEIRKKVSDSLTGRICSDEHRRRVAEANIGKILVNNGSIAKRISSSELELYINTNWSRGRLPKDKNKISR